MRQLRLLAVAGILAAVPARDALATGFLNYCYAGSMQTCFSVTVTTVQHTGGTTVTMRLRNESIEPSGTQASWITALALTQPSDVGSASGLSVGTFGTVGLFGITDPNSYWNVLTHTAGGGSQLEVQLASGPRSANGQTPKGAVVGCGTNVGGTTQYFRTCAPTYAGWVEFTFETSGDWDASEAQLMVKFQTANGSFECNTDQPDTCSNVVPEPVTMLLLGSGLAGMGGFGLIRRRKRNGDIESA